MNTILQPVAYEQLWPWDLLEEQDLDFDLIEQGRNSPEIAWLQDQGYHAVISVVEHVAIGYTEVLYKFYVRPEDLTILLLKFPKARNSYEV